MHPSLEELEEALDTLKKFDALGRDPGKPMTVRQALDTVFRAEPRQLCEAGLAYLEPPEREEDQI